MVIEWSTTQLWTKKDKDLEELLWSDLKDILWVKIQTRKCYIQLAPISVGKYSSRFLFSDT